MYVVRKKRKHKRDDIFKGFSSDPDFEIIQIPKPTQAPLSKKFEKCRKTYFVT